MIQAERERERDGALRRTFRALAGTQVRFAGVRIVSWRVPAVNGSKSLLHPRNGGGGGGGDDV